MAYRVFRDEDGTEWQAWEVVPRLAERRARERRQRESAATAEERRRQADRRLIVSRRPELADGLSAGWLCFDCSREKRRLTPIPDDWPRCSDAQLAEYCARAAPAARPAEGDE